MLKLKWPDYPSPLWFYSGRRVHVGRVREDGLVDAESDKLALLEGEMLPPGTELRIVCREGYLTAETVSEYTERVAREDKAARAAARARREQHEQDWQERQIAAQRDAEDANARLRIPVQWTSGLKTLLSGLSATSNGSGDNRRSVTHILLLEPLDEPKLQRPAQTFLCTSASGSNGQAWTGKLHTHSQGAAGPYVSKVTCAQCLKIARRWFGLSNGRAPTVLA